MLRQGEFSDSAADAAYATTVLEPLLESTPDACGMGLGNPVLGLDHAVLALIPPPPLCIVLSYA